MLDNTTFVCGNVAKCINSIAASGLNDIQLKAIRRAPKTCDKCKKTTLWLEQGALFDNIETKQVQRNGGRHNAKSHNNRYGSH